MKILMVKRKRNTPSAQDIEAINLEELDHNLIVSSIVLLLTRIT